MGRFGGHRSPHYDPHERGPVFVTGPAVCCCVTSHPKSGSQKQQAFLGSGILWIRNSEKMGQDGSSLFHDVWRASQQGLKTGGI